MKTDTGILITNIGSPDAPTPFSVACYLRKFLSDPRVISIPKIFWYPILYGIILPFRSHNSAKLYQKIWTAKGSPLTVLSLELANELQEKLQVPVVLGMHYGNPSIKSALNLLRAQNIKKIIVLPLYPQYSASTTASTFDIITKNLCFWKIIPEIYFLTDYADHPDYINAISESISSEWERRKKPQHLLFSFHSLPKRYIDGGDPYQERCKLTAHLVAEQLKLPVDFWSIAFQSRLGKAEWITPYTDAILKSLPQKGIHYLDVVCPGFAIDCLETLEEISIRGKEQFLSSGGKIFHYIPALNANEKHLNILINRL